MTNSTVIRYATSTRHCANGQETKVEWILEHEPYTMLLRQGGLRPETILLVGEGKYGVPPNEVVIPYVGEPTIVTGEAEDRSGQYQLKVTADSYRPSR